MYRRTRRSTANPDKIRVPAGLCCEHFLVWKLREVAFSSNFALQAAKAQVAKVESLSKAVICLLFFGETHNSGTI